MDEMDMASRTSEFLQEIALKNKKPVLPRTGRCYNCEDPVPDALYCDADCREDHERRVFLAR